MNENFLDFRVSFTFQVAKKRIIKLFRSRSLEFISISHILDHVMLLDTCSNVILNLHLLDLYMLKYNSVVVNEFIEFLFLFLHRKGA
jgi:hypothetical protein